MQSQIRHVNILLILTQLFLGISNWIGLSLSGRADIYFHFGNGRIQNEEMKMKWVKLLLCQWIDERFREDEKLKIKGEKRLEGENEKCSMTASQILREINFRFFSRK